MREWRLSSSAVVLCGIIGVIALAGTAACLVRGSVGAGIAIGSLAVFFLGLAITGRGRDGPTT